MLHIPYTPRGGAKRMVGRLRVIVFVIVFVVPSSLFARVVVFVIVFVVSSGLFARVRVSGVVHLVICAFAVRAIAWNAGAVKARYLKVGFPAAGARIRVVFVNLINVLVD